VWNLSLTGWRFSGDLPLRVGEVCSLTVNLSSRQARSSYERYSTRKILINFTLRGFPAI